MTDTIVHSAFHVRFSKGYELIHSHPNHVPVMFETSKDVKLEKDTIMCPRDSSLCNIILQFRKNLITDADMTSSMGFIFYIKTQDGKTILPKMTEKVGDLHDIFHGADMWLRIKIDKEDIFG